MTEEQKAIMKQVPKETTKLRKTSKSKMNQLDEKLIFKTIVECYGIEKSIRDKLDVSYSEFETWVGQGKRDENGVPIRKAILKKARNLIADRAEEVLIDLLNNGSREDIRIQAAKTLLTATGRERGYQPGNTGVQVLVDKSGQDTKVAIQALFGVVDEQ